MNIFNKLNLRKTMEVAFNRNGELCEIEARGYLDRDLEEEKKFVVAIIHQFYEIYGQHADSYYGFSD